MTARAVIISIDVSSSAISKTNECTADVLARLHRYKRLASIELSTPEDDAPGGSCLTFGAMQNCSNLVLLLTPDDGSVKFIPRSIDFKLLLTAAEICSTGSHIPDALQRFAQQKTRPAGHSSLRTLF